MITDQEEILPNKIFRKSYINLDGPWEINFDKKLGGIGNITIDKLKDWTTFEDPKIKFFSGTATYHKSFEMNSNFEKVGIEIKNPGFVAEVLINNISAGTIWCSPWQLDISSLLKNGTNNIEIKVANSLINRMIFDLSLPEKDKLTYSYPPIVSNKDQLIPSGITEVRLVIESTK